MIIILGHYDQHTALITARLEERGMPYTFFHSGTYPDTARLQATLRLKEFSHGFSLGQTPLAAVHRLYWYYFYPPQPSKSSPEGVGSPHETLNSLLTFLRCLGDKVTNPAQSVAAHRFKTHQLGVIKKLGVLTPKTLITNNPDALKTFVCQFKEGAVIKNLTGIGYPQRLLPESIDAWLVENSSLAPAIVQEFIDGEDIRVHVVGDQTFPSQVHSQQWTFVSDPNLTISTATMPDTMHQQSCAIARALGLVVSGVDFRRTADGRYYCLEANPSPQFGIYQQHTQQPIGQAIADLLCQ